MPSWRLHLTAGVIITAILIYLCIITGLSYVFIKDDQINYFFLTHLLVAAFLASLTPDFDYRKTRIRNAFGPCLGLFIMLSYIYQNRSNVNEINPAFIIVLLLVFVLIPFIAGLVIPFKHHGKMHSFSAACFYGLCWSGVELLIFNLSLMESSLIGGFGFIIYISHLVLDGNLKLI